MSRIQLALNVNDIDDAIAFYSTLFDTPPAKRRPGYANFAIENPPVKLVLFENPAESGTLNHVGVERSTVDDVYLEADRLEQAGLNLEVEDDVVCCCALQGEHWVTGPDGQRSENCVVLADSQPELEGVTAATSSESRAGDPAARLQAAPTLLRRRRPVGRAQPRARPAPGAARDRAVGRRRRRNSSVPGAVILGAGPGLGRAIARRFAQEDLPVALVARSRATVESVAATLTDLDTPVLRLNADCTDEAALRRALDEAYAAFGTPDVVVYNAAIIQTDAVGALSVEAHLVAWAVNVLGAHAAAAHVIPGMAGRGSGSFLVTGGMPDPKREYVSLSVGKAGPRLRDALAEWSATAGIRSVADNLIEYARMLFESERPVVTHGLGGRALAPLIADVTRKSGLEHSFESTVTDYPRADQRIGRVAAGVDVRTYGFLITGAVHNLITAGDAYPRPEAKELRRMLRMLAQDLAGDEAPGNRDGGRRKCVP